jgi:hypothetical protein
MIDFIEVWIDFQCYSIMMIDLALVIDSRDVIWLWGMNLHKPSSVALCMQKSKKFSKFTYISLKCLFS